MKKIIITGCPRSGTTALCTLLSHGDCFVTNEIGNFIWPEEEFEDRILQSADNYYVKYLLNMKKIDRDDFIAKVKDDPKTYCETINENYGIDIVGDKLPGYLNSLPDIFNENRDAYFIITLRSMQHFVASSINNFNKGRDMDWCFDKITKAENFWVENNLKLLEGVHYILSKGGKAILVKYEDIGLDIDKTLLKIDKFLGVELNVPNPDGGFKEVHRKAKSFIPSDQSKMLMDLFGY